MSTQRREIAVQALKELWQELKFEGDALIFISPMQSRVQLEHHPMLLDQLVANGKQRKKSIFGQLKSWELLEAPAYAQGIAVSLLSVSLNIFLVLHIARKNTRR